MASASLVSAQISPTDVDPPVIEKIEANTEIEVVSPTNTFYGTRGLSQTSSAEALGEGRLIFGLQGAWYQQLKNFSGAPKKDANIFTGIAAISLGLNRHVDVFGSFAGFGSSDYDNSNASGIGAIGGGLQGTLPFNPTYPIRMGAQVGIYQGLSDNAINTNGADGYNYFETRTGLDFKAKLIQTVVLGSEELGFKMHFNEGVVTSGETGTDALLLFAVGAQLNLFSTVLGLEANSRTNANEIDIASDPIWVTPSVQLRTAYDINLTLGADISIAKTRDNGTRALEPYRLFGGLAFSFDTEENKRRMAREKARKEDEEQMRLRRQNRALNKDLVTQAQEDSLAQLRLKSESDSSMAAMADKAKQDSLAMANRAHQDSLALLESKRNLEIEKAKRSDAEKQLLSTGLLLMDAVYFETGKTEISINSKPYLNIIAKMLTKYPKLQIEVSGHTDDVGSDANNQILSQGRAESVANYMKQVAPQLNSMLSGKGYGESMPKSDNKSAAGRKLNRRTELQVLNKEMLKEYNP